MKQFAKIFETPVGRVVVMQTADDGGNDVVRMYFNPGAPRIPVRSVDFTFENEAQEGAVLARLTDATVGHLIERVIEQARDSFGVKE